VADPDEPGRAEVAGDGAVIGDGAATAAGLEAAADAIPNLARAACEFCSAAS
jgi:hypothetical protein